MHRALSAGIAATQAAVVIGSDCPALEAGDLREASAGLLEGADTVIGPAADGGYYLIGARAQVPDVFTDVAWGTPEVLALTRDRLEALGLVIRVLAERADVDRPDDLSSLPPDWIPSVFI